MSTFLILVMAAGLLAGLLYCEKNELQTAKLTVKTILSTLFILTIVFQSRPVPMYFLFLLIGMLFCLGCFCRPAAIYQKRVFESAYRPAAILWRSVYVGVLSRLNRLSPFHNGCCNWRLFASASKGWEAGMLESWEA